jgi:hypothetical protein
MKNWAFTNTGLRAKTLGSFTKRKQSVSQEVRPSEPQVVEASSPLLITRPHPRSCTLVSDSTCVTTAVTYWSQ